MPASVGALLQAVVDNIGPDDRRFEDPSIGKMPRAENAFEHVDQLPVWMKSRVAGDA
jgi:hypothetical protein